jgi:small subunit ribosomal protein S11
MSAQKKHNSTNKKKKSLTICDVHIHMTFNNIIASITNTFGDVVVWSSAGKMGFKGSRRSTPFAAKVTIEDAMKTALDLNMKTVRSIIVKGICASRESAIREVMKITMSKNMPPIEMIRDVTPVPHNGTKPPKKRRV